MHTYYYLDVQSTNSVVMKPKPLVSWLRLLSRSF